jgi:outer membrane protein TolC
MRPHIPTIILTCASLASIGGCASNRTAKVATNDGLPTANCLAETIGAAGCETPSHSQLIQVVDFEEPDSDNHSSDEKPECLPAPVVTSPLASLEQAAIDQNSRLIRLYQEYEAAAARSRYVDKLPDPKLGANIFGNPIETAAGSQRANMNLSQTIPWLGRLNAAQQQASFEALAVRAEYAVERLRVVTGIRVGWYRLYVIDKQIETIEANQKLLESLIEVANARIATGKATRSDVLLGTLELSQLEERLLTYRKQRWGIEAEINRLTGRSADSSIQSATKLNVSVPELDVATIHEFALTSQPEIEAARLRAQATHWGIEAARLSRRPEFLLSANYFFTDNNRPVTPVVNVGEDPWALGVQVSLPIWHDKYDEMQNEAGRKHQASHSSVQELHDRYESLILDLLTEANRAAETARLYQSTILPQARQTLSADQDAYSNGSVEFDRVIRDYRNLLTLELGYEKAIGDRAIANARIQQAAGQDLTFPLIPEAQEEQ